jgi:hypothetical protein
MIRGFVFLGVPTSVVRATHRKSGAEEIGYQPKGSHAKY